jgi:20S proteasome alpha/beta subunit
LKGFKDSLQGNNILDSQSQNRHPDRKQKRKTPVTIIVGIISDGEIVLASDSQTTYGTAKRSDVEKISVIEFSNAVALVAESGAAQLTGRAVELLQEKAKGKELSDYRMVADLAQESLREVKSSVIKSNEGCNFSEDKWERYFRDDNQADLMVAHYFENRPYIYTVDISNCIANKAKLHYEAIGCGANLGGYLLSELSYPKMDSELAAAIAVYVVESVKKHDAYCGGDTKVAILREQKLSAADMLYASSSLAKQADSLALPSLGGYPLPPCKVFSKYEVEKLVGIVSEMDNKTKKQRHKIIQRALQKETAILFADILKPSAQAQRKALLRSMSSLKAKDKK